MGGKKTGSLIGKLIKWGLLLALAGLIFLVASWFWHTRSIDPVELSESELKELEQKISPVLSDLEQGQAPSGSLILTQRECNGYINHHTDHGKRIQLEFTDGLLLAHVHEKAPKGTPLIGGTKIRGKVGLELSAKNGKPVVKLVSANAFGTSYPEDYLQKYMNKNVFSILEEQYGLDYPLDCVDDIKVTDGMLEITFF